MASLSMSGFVHVRRIGRGNYGTAHLVRSRDGKHNLVVKKIPLVSLNQEEKDSARQEVQVLKSLNHRHIVKYLGDFLQDETLHIVMEFCEGETWQRGSNVSWNCEPYQKICIAE